VLEKRQTLFHLPLPVVDLAYNIYKDKKYQLGD